MLFQQKNLKKRVVSLFLASLLTLLFPVYQVIASDQIGPTAILTVSPSGGSVYTVFEFDASESFDSRGYTKNLEYRMNFDYSYDTFTDWGTKNTFQYQFTRSGEKKVILEVRDKDNGLTDRTIIRVTVDDDLGFNAGLVVDPLKGDLLTEFRFKTIITADLATPVSDYEVRFDFDGDREWDTYFSKSHTAYHIFPSIGYYTPRIEVRDPYGNTIEIVGLKDDNEELGENREDMILVSRSGVPRATLDVYPNVGISDHTTFYFDASDSFDYEDYSELEYRFDFQNDGIFDTLFSEKSEAQTKYSTPGTYTALVQIMDSDGYTDESYTRIEVRERDMAPDADFTITTDLLLSDKNTGTLATIFRFNASRSRDPEDRTSGLQVRWDFENDGIFDTDFSTNKRAEHRYLETGTYEVRVQVLDSAGNTVSAYYTLTVVANADPEASLTITPLAGTPATVFTFDPSNSRDGQYRDSYLKVRYDFDSDGKFDTEFERLRKIRYNFANPGTYTITMQIRDPEGKISEDSETIEVLENKNPEAALAVSPSEGTFSTTFILDASASFDNKPTSGELKYRWDYDYTGEDDIQYDTNFSNASVRRLKFNRVNKTGPIKVRVEVRDHDGIIASTVQEIYLHWSSGYMEYFRRHGVLRGYNGDMKPDQAITRAELTKVILEAKDIRLSTKKFEEKFSDVFRKDWFWKYVHTASELGIVSGYSDGTFRPNQTITRAEALALISRAFSIDTVSTSDKIFDDVAPGQWYTDYVTTAYESGLVSGHGDGNFYPHRTLTRGEASKITYFASQKYDF